MDVLIYYFVLIALPILTCGLILLIAFLIINRFRYDLFRPKFEDAKSKIDSFLTNMIFSPFDETLFKTEIEQFKKGIPFEKKWCKKLILNEIIFLKLNLKGEVTNTFHFLYEQFELFEYTKKLLKSNRFYLKCLGMYQLESLEYKKGAPLITPFLNHKNRSVKSSAFLSLISLKPNKLETLVDFSHQITIAEEINIMDILHQKKTKIPSNLSQWIKSDNLSIIKLGIKLMVFYNYTNDNETILKLLKHNDKSVRHEAIIAVKFLYIHQAEPILIEQFKHEDTLNKLEIFDTLSGIGATNSEHFIAQLLENKTDEDIKLDAVYCLNKINSHYFEQHFLDNEDVQKVVKHVKTPYL
ncbi:HEAT repeat domain-containing protein [Flavobacterium sp. M31R6]|uniref:HEAT repeat domain-containing protein n=1 Tax=Flavobacterium sp. M31R6 TaxID=2739062 RepID=UPI00156812E4|nr:HEAT repeat domain-containing protein [Flavobacterium sp. M31R6]QKJ63076.1 HEAT repeat domain-containing protein [Flavobacterium sp. M31R6]